MVSTQVAAMDTSCGPEQAPWENGRFDLLADTLGLGVQPPGFGGSGEVAAAERYRIVGAAPGTPIPFTLRMPISAVLFVFPSDLHAMSSGTAKLEVDGVVLAQASEVRDCTDAFTCTTTGNLTTSLTAALSLPAWREFVVVARLSASVNGGIANPGTVDIAAGLHFDDLPAGIAVVSCHGATVGTVGVGHGPIGGGLRFLSSGANPSPGPIPVDFFVPGDGPVTLRLLDIAGRTVERARLDVSAPGPNAATLGSRRSLAPGTYVVRLTQGAESRSRLVTVVR
jgi:hypothetical protein